MVKVKRRPFVLIVRDGWGHNPDAGQNEANAIYLADTPVDDRLMADYPSVLIRTSGEAVGLPEGVMGNSEVGHQNIGAGRIVDQEIMRINKAIRNGSFFTNEALVGAYDRAKKTGGAVHIMGLCSDIGVHSVLGHLYAILETAKRAGFDPSRVFLHAFGDGRDSPPDSGIRFIAEIEAKMKEIGVGRVASVCGRYYAMDRNNFWDRVERAYHMLTDGRGHRAASAEAAFRQYYDNPTSPEQFGDEFVEPTVVCGDGDAPVTIRDGDSIVFFNFRGDRPREITKAFTFDVFPFSETDKDGREHRRGFNRHKKLDVYYATLTAYETGLPVQVMFPKPPKMKDMFGDYTGRLGLRQLRCAETEKFAHVTFFFNDYRDEPFPGEDRALIPSPRDVATYDRKPEMSAPQVTEEMLRRINSDKYDIIILNYANCDMVGHTGDLAAAKKAVEAVDAGVGRVVDAVLAGGGSLIITADHGNSEQMIDPATGDAQRAHTTFDVPLIVVDESCKRRRLRERGTLADIIPTALEIMGLERPDAMSGRSLLA
ncbi:MAG: 2,3-bisphosphoglycerate-independent phosphoglycerate mutase [Phycisphaerales bacterium]|nr:MAG: 2,3-bisphosphoglycerate-independent phosphoglycerate mutase [Phycisphaerales bacterium]